MSNDNNQPLVSVLMTVYNREAYLSDAIESVLASTYQNWELIITDDQSKDNSLEIAKSYEARDQRIKVYLNEQNLGDYPNRNKAASYAQGIYLKYLDADDLIHDHSLEHFVKHMELYPEAGWGVTTLANDPERAYPFVLQPAEIYRRHYFEKKSVLHRSPLSVIIKREAFEKLNGFKPSRHFGDFELWHRLAIYFPVVLLPAGLVWWRQHEGQEADKRKSKILLPLDTVDAAMESVRHPDFPLNDQERSAILKMTRNFKYSYVLGLIKQRRIGSSIKVLRYWLRK